VRNSSNPLQEVRGVCDTSDDRPETSGLDQLLLEAASSRALRVGLLLLESAVDEERVVADSRDLLVVRKLVQSSLVLEQIVAATALRVIGANALDRARLVHVAGLVVVGLALVTAAIVVVVVVQVCAAQVETREEDQSADTCAEQERRGSAPAGGRAACAVGSRCAAGVARAAAESARRAHDSGAACARAGA
jgi:hypothetical protein